MWLQPLPIKPIFFLFAGALFLCQSTLHAQARSHLNPAELVVDESGLVYKDGNVGVATANPQYRLEVNGDMILTRVNNRGSAGYSLVEQDGTTGSSLTVDWTLSNTQHIIVGANNLSLTFDDPEGPANLILLIKREGIGVITWPATVSWGGGVAPSFNYSEDLATPTNIVIDLVGMYFDGVTYNAAANLDFR